MYSSNCSFLTCIQISEEVGWVVWYSYLFKNFPQFVVIHTVKGFGIVNKAEVDVSLELSCFSDDSTYIGNLISDSSAFSKSSLNIWKFFGHVLLKPNLKNFEHYVDSIWDECNGAVVWTFFGIAFVWDWNENWPFPVLWPLPSVPKCWHIECSIYIASSYRYWNSSVGIPLPPLAFFAVTLPKAHLTSYSRISGSRWGITPSWLSGSLKSFSYSSSVYSCHLFLVSLASVYICTVSVLYCTKCFLGISNFVKEIYSLFLLIT